MQFFMQLLLRVDKAIELSVQAFGVNTPWP